MRRASLRARRRQAPRVGVDPPRGDAGNAALRAPNAGDGPISAGSL